MTNDNDEELESVMSLPETETEPEPEPVEVSSEEPERVLEEEEATPPPKVKRRKKKRSKKSSATKASASPSRSIRSVYPGVVVISQGMPSGAKYRWSSPGSVVQVAAEDVGVVMKKNGSGARECCGSSSLPVYFEFAD